MAGKEMVEVKAGARIKGGYRRPTWRQDSEVEAFVLATLVIRGEARILVTRNAHDVSDEALQVLYLGSFDPINTVIEQGEPIAKVEIDGLFVNPRNPRYAYLARLSEAEGEMSRAIYGSFPLSEVVAESCTFVRYVLED